jgi:hypothetical protein
LANVWGVAFADGHVRIPPQLNRAVAILERALNKKLRLEGESQINLAKYIQNLDLYDSASPKALEQVLKDIGIDVEVVDATPEQLAELKKGIDMQIVQDGLGYAEHDVGGIDYHQGLNIQEKGRGITINNISSSLNLDSATLRGFKVEIIGLERRNREV